MIRSRLLLFCLAAALAVGLGLACRNARDGRASPYVQPSSGAAPTAFATISPELRFVPGCVEVTPGETVEWDSQETDTPVNVTSLGDPLELYSPNLQPPLSCGTPNATCWRHTFANSGCYDYFDTNSGSPGRIVRDPYYGTIKYVGQGGDISRAIVCVDPSGRCRGICCQTRTDCPNIQGRSFECISRRCIDVATEQPIPCTDYGRTDGGVP